MMRRNASVWIRCAGFAAATLLAGSVYAAGEGPRYTYGEIGYSRVDFDNLNDDGNFGNIGGSIGIRDKLHLFAAYSKGSVDVSRFNVDLTNVEAGMGLNLPISNTVDVVFDVAYLWTEVDANNAGSDSEDGFGLRGGVRAMLTPKFELNGGATYAEYNGSNDDDNTAVYVGGVYNFTDMLAMTADVSAGDNVTSYGVGLRLYFDVK